MLSQVVLLMVAAVWPAHGQVAASAAAEPESTQPVSALEGPLRDRVMCGPNVLYLLLELYGIPVGPEEIERYIPSHREGMSLLDLRAACGDFGLRSEVRQCSLDELAVKLRSPVVARINPRGFPGSQRFHYVIILRFEGDSLLAIDGTAGKVVRFAASELEGLWSGYVLIPEAGRATFSLLFFAGCIVCWIILGYIAYRIR